MRTTRQSHIDGQWLDPADARSIDVIDPSTARSYAQLRIGDAADVDRAVGAAKQAFDTYSRWPVDERVALLRRVLDIYQRRYEEVARTISQEMGAPIAFARAMAAVGTAHLEQTIRALQSFRFSTQTDSLLVSHEPIGVCALITPWNWPINQIVCKVAPALAAGCTMVLAERDRAVQRDPVRGDPARSRRAARRVQPRARLRARSGRRAVAPPGCRHGVVHGRRAPVSRSRRRPPIP